MTSRDLLFRVKQYLKYWLFREDAHSLQSSLVYDLYVKTLISKKKPIDPAIIALKRKQALDDTIVVQEFGSYTNRPRSTKISAIAKRGISSFHDSLILKSLVRYSNSRNILELGSSLGLNAIVLAKDLDVCITSIDIDPKLTAIAQGNAKSMGLETSIRFLNADADDFIEKEATQSIAYDFIYIDANHTFEATTRYYQKTKPLLSQEGIIVFDDINWSKQMNSAWEEIKKDITQGLIIENYTMGIWIKNSNPKASYLLKF